MKIKVRYENSFQTLEVNADEMWVCLSLEKTDNLDENEKEERIQEAFNEQFNRPEYNNMHKFERHRGQSKEAFHGEKEVEQPAELMDLFGSTDDEDRRNARYAREVLCEKIRKAMKPEQAELIIAICMDGQTPQEYATRVGDKANNVSHRLQRAKENFRKIFPRASF
ncbi:MAG: hypothetical protein LKE29_05405 [Acidaminococcaceae bacterium]|jgi:hypothetical protein|nr:hypothetical protein [Acidaminococcaceae bacterium]